ncbi:hypothetical protein GLO73106DRAFT_00023050 [Gloeocapsa sp. PCC 73106]|nr:hypothetical protein GLO73106DRAFT_00023050 [Gloeocapsa sp. PCC 73106]
MIIAQSIFNIKFVLISQVFLFCNKSIIKLLLIAFFVKLLKLIFKRFY